MNQDEFAEMNYEVNIRQFRQEAGNNSDEPWNKIPDWKKAIISLQMGIFTPIHAPSKKDYGSDRYFSCSCFFCKPFFPEWINPGALAGIIIAPIISIALELGMFPSLLFGMSAGFIGSTVWRRR